MRSNRFKVTKSYAYTKCVIMPVPEAATPEDPLALTLQLLQTPKLQPWTLLPLSSIPYLIRLHARVL